MAKMPTSDQLLAQTPTSFPDKGWMDIKAEFIPGRYPYPAKAETMEKMGRNSFEPVIGSSPYLGS